MDQLNKLLELDIVKDNEYYRMYCDLIISNLDTKRIKYKTQRHHIIPVSYYSFNNIDVDNSKDNLINLEYKYHVYAHYLL